MKLSDSFKKLKALTDDGFLMKARSIALHGAVRVVNFDTWAKLLLKGGEGQVKPGDRPSGRPKIAILSSYRPIFWHGSIFEDQLGKALNARGYDVLNILCGGFQERCDVQFFKGNKDTNPVLCQDCKLRNELFYNRNGSKYIYMDSYADQKEIERVREKVNALTTLQEAIDFVYDDLPVGKWAHLSTSRYFLRLTLNDSEHLDTFKKFLISSISVHSAFQGLLKEHKFENFLFFNGAYPSWRMPLEIVRKSGQTFWSYEFNDRERILFVKNGISVQWADVNDKFNTWLASVKPEDEAKLEAEVNEHMAARRKQFLSTLVDIENSIDTGKRIDVAVFTNVVWDSAVFGRDTIFKDQFDWIRRMVNWTKDHPQYNVVLRVHPAERQVVWNMTQERMIDFVHKEFPELPPNLALFPPEDRRNSYTIMNKAKVVATYTSSVGLECALSDKAPLVGSWAHYSRPGVTITPTSLDEYFETLEKLIHQDPKDQLRPRKLAEKYAYWYFRHYHRLNNTDLHSEPFVISDDSWYLRVPKVIPTQSEEFKELVDEFVGSSNETTPKPLQSSKPSASTPSNEKAVQ